MTDTLERARELAEQVVSAANIVSHDGYYEVDIDRVEQVLAAALSLPAREVGEVVQRAVEHGQACLSTISRDTSHVQIERAALRTLLRFATEALATTPAPREMDLVEASSLRSTVRDIAESEAIPTAAEAYEWCRDLARATLAKLDRSAEEG
jgi:hypothetical protein